MKTIFFSVSIALFLQLTFSQEFEITADTMDGKLMYESWCGRCHGDDGRGVVEGIQLDAPVPDFTDCSFNSREPRKDWMAVIMDGGPARGLAMTMPSWRESISDEQAGVIISHIKTFCSETGWPPGELNFRRAQVTLKAFPENEALMIPSYTSTQTASAVTRFVYESRVGSSGQWEIALPLISRFGSSPAGGVGDIEVAGKYVIFHDLSAMSILSAGLEVGFPTGRRSDGFGSGSVKLAPFVAAAKGFGEAFVQSSVKFERRLKTGASELFYTIALTLPLTDEKKGLFPTIEVNGISANGNSGNTILITPQLYIGLVQRGHIALSLGTQIPVAGTKPFDYRLVGFLLWEYADGGLWW
ncbi:MAG: c-type cytochrome [Ignavibacteriales bacterium]|nr:c-type cytochrome [Ignavibacteriales bacterium]